MKAREFRIFDPGSLKRACALIAQLPVSEERALLIEVSPYSEQRTSAQNRRYWATLNELAEVPVEGRKYSADTWHEYAKAKWIGKEEIELPGGETITRPISTTSLNVGQFAEYLTQVEVFAAQQGILLGADQ